MIGVDATGCVGSIGYLVEGRTLGLSLMLTLAGNHSMCRRGRVGREWEPSGGGVHHIGHSIDTSPAQRALYDSYMYRWSMATALTRAYNVPALLELTNKWP